jgi:hypothetical protein
VKEELAKVGLGYIWQNQQENSVSRACKIIEERCNDTEKQNLFVNIRGKRSLIFYCDTKMTWGKEYMVCCTRNERNELAWCKTGMYLET